MRLKSNKMLSGRGMKMVSLAKMQHTEFEEIDNRPKSIPKDACGKGVTLNHSGTRKHGFEILAERQPNIQVLASSSLILNEASASDEVSETHSSNNVVVIVNKTNKLPVVSRTLNTSCTLNDSFVEGVSLEQLLVNNEVLEGDLQYDWTIDDSALLQEDSNVLIEVKEPEDVESPNNTTVYTDEAIQNVPRILEENDMIVPVLNQSLGQEENEYQNKEPNYLTEDGNGDDPEFIPDTESNQNKKNRSRKRHANPEQWERAIRKKQRMSGESYLTAKGKTMPEKSFVQIENCLCKYKCVNNISVDNQQSLFKEFWKIGNACLQKNYITSLVVEEPVERRRKRNNEVTGKEKKNSRSYFLPDNDKMKRRVCRPFFCKVFQISTQVVELALKKTSLSGGMFLGEDGRKGRPAPNKTKPDDVEHVKRHINSFPRMESHYCRKDSKKLYLSPELNVAELYRLYLNDYCQKENINPVKEGVFRSVFKSYDPPLATFIPKKDQCSKCNQYRDAEDKAMFGIEYETHVRRKKEAMEMKNRDMNSTEENQVTVTFDLQAVLMVPFAGDCQIYYKRKLSVYNFTILDSNSNGYCYLWDETNGMKGSSEIGTGLVTYMKNLPEGVNHVTTYSDTCGGQNRNQFVATAMLFVVNKTHIETVDMKYMEPGHTYLEADSMHSTIERARKHKKVYTTEEWGLLIQLARKKPKPYEVKIQNYKDIYDLSKLGKTVMCNRTVNNKGETVNWMKIKWLRFEKSKPFTVQYKYELQEDVEFQELEVRLNAKEPITWDSIELNRKYSEPVAISKAKKKDLLSLLKTGVIPQAYNQFISNLPVSEKAKDLAPYGEEEEEDEVVPVRRPRTKKKRSRR